MAITKDLIDVSFTSFAAWQNWHRANPWIFDASRIAANIRKVTDHGLVDPVAGPVAASEVEVAGLNYRETITAHGLNSRTRALLLLALELTANRDAGQTDVYACEFVTPFAQRLRAVFPRFVGSEYFPHASVDADSAQAFPGIQHQDVQ
ncbi:MAG: hypothetical protein JSS20_17840, partial [Proteobacteria bacterium]|nr:hypothetical protein [Pseudomonadota bacterium]